MCDCKPGFQLVPQELSDAACDAALRATAVWLDVKGSALTVNREKMKARWRAALQFVAPSANSQTPSAPKTNG